MFDTSFILRNLPAFQSADYRRLFTSFFFASASRWALVLGQSWLVFELTDSSLAVGAVYCAGAAQFVIVGPFAGAIADRIDRRRLAINALILSVICSTALAAITLANVVEVWHVIAIAVVQGWAQAAAMPAQRSLLANLVPREHLMNAVALGGMPVHGSRFAGPLLGGILLATLGAGAVFLLSAAILTVAVLLISRIQHRAEPFAGSSGVASVMTDVRYGFVYTWADRRIRLVIALIIFHCSFTMAFNSLLPRLTTDIGGGDVTFSLIMMGIGTGAIIGTLAISVVRNRILQGASLNVVGIGSGIAMLLMGLFDSVTIVVIGAILAGATQATYMAISQVLVQEIVPDSLRGRVMAIYTMMAAGHMALINLGFGVLADEIGVRPLLVVPALVWIGIFLVTALISVDLRNVLRKGEFHTTEAPTVNG